MSKIIDKSHEQQKAEAEVAEFRERLGPFVVAAETTRMAMVFMDAKEPGNPIIFANDSFLSLTGKEVLGQDFNFLMAHCADPDALAKIKAEFEGNPKSGTEIRYRRKDGSAFWAALFISPVRDEDGDIVQYFASYIDLTRHKEQQIQSKMLIEELNHRVKNTLSTVQSIVWQAMRTSSDPKVIRESIESRLLALSRSHDLLTLENWDSAGLFDVVKDALEPFEVTGSRSERIVIEGANIRIPPHMTLAFGIAFHELATNAVKYGALSNGTGSILVAWTVEPSPNGDRLVLNWQEKGGPPVTPPARKGFGSRVLENGLAHELEGDVRLDFPVDGMTSRISFPVPRGDRGE